MGAGQRDIGHLPDHQIGAGARLQMADLVLPAEARGPTHGRGVESVARRHRGWSVAIAAEQQRGARLQPHRGMIGRGGAVASEPHAHAPPAQTHQVGRAAADQHVGAWALGNADAGASQPVDLGAARIDEMGDPGALAGPADPLEILHRRAAIDLGAVGVLVMVLGEMGMQPEIVGVGQPGGLRHDALGNRKQRTWRQRDTAHRTGPGVVIGLDQPHAVGQDVVLRLHHRGGRQPALLDRARHRAARGVETEADVPGRPELGIDEEWLRMDIHVVHRRGAAAHHELRHGDIGRQVDGFIVEPGP